MTEPLEPPAACRNTISVMLVDDHPVVRAGFRRLLETAGDLTVVAEAVSGEDSIRLYDQHHPDVVVMDLSMPGIGGLEAVRRILARDPEARLMVFSVHDSEAMLSRTMQAGVLGYITKQAAPGLLPDAVRLVARGQPFIDPALAGKLPQSGGGLLERLTPREFEVFRLLADGHPVASIAEILSISPKTAGVHQTRIMNKLELRNSTQLVRLALSTGVIDS